MQSKIKSIPESVRPPNSPDYSDDDEKLQDIQLDAPIRSHSIARERQNDLILLIAVSFLCLGFFTTLAFRDKTAPKNNGPLHVDSHTTVPKEVFVPVKKVTVFQPDERYIGGTAEVEQEWEKQVAGHDAVWIEKFKCKVYVEYSLEYLCDRESPCTSR